MIRFAARGDYPSLKTLWTSAFGDTREALDEYFALRHTDENMLVDAREAGVAGMLTMLPVTLSASGGQAWRARYIYAVATDERCRGQGVASALLNAAHAHMRSLGEAAAVLAPASDSLFDYYGKRGYKTAFFSDVVTMHAGTLPPFPPKGRVSACSAAGYTRLRNQAFHGSRLYVRWDENAVAYAMRTFAQKGGVTEVSWEGGRGCAAWEAAEDGVVVRELALSGGDFQTALAVLHSRLGAKRYTLRLAEGTAPGAVPRPVGMILWLIPEPETAGTPPYLSLTMD
jgi:predicted N-acetyltransferase YhbS